MLRHDSAMQAVTAKADKLSPEWSAKAAGLLTVYLKALGLSGLPTKPFIAEHFRAWAENYRHLPYPHDSRAYGSVLRNAAKSGLIRRVGYRADSYGSPKSLWVAK